MNRIKISVFVTAMVLFSQFVYSQTQREVWTEDFDSTTISFTQSPTTKNYWVLNPTYSTSGIYSYRGRVPNTIGDSTVLTTPFYDMRQPHIMGQLRFRHICMVSPNDAVRIEYRLNDLSSRWGPIPKKRYLGGAENYNEVFSTNSYPEWRSGNFYDLPQHSWWKEEVFDLSDIGSYNEIQFRFIIKKGSVLGTQFAYGWMLDDFRVIVDDHEIVLPTVELINPLVMDTVHTAGPFDVFVKAQPKAASITSTSFKYTTIYNGIATDYIVPLTNTQPNVYKASIPNLLLNTRVLYSAEVEDALGNKNGTSATYIIAKNSAKNYDSNAMSIFSLDLPTQATVVGGVQTDAEISLRNEGDLNLTSATINWSINGITQTPFPWNGNLSWGFSDLNVKIGDYVPRMDVYDTLVFWGTNINGLPNTHSDSLIVRLYGCTQSISGTIPVSPKSGFSETFELLKKCGVGGDITLSLDSGKYVGSLDLSNLSTLMGNHHLTITSASGNRKDVILLPDSGVVGITLGNTNNLTINGITLDASWHTAIGIQFVSACTNITISNCALLGSITTTSSTVNISGTPIYKASSTGIANNIRITNNFIKGGYYGIRFYGGISGNFGKNIVIDSNELTSQYYYGIDFTFTDIEVLHNTITYHDGVGVKQVQNSWRAIFSSSSAGNIIGNKVYQMSGLNASISVFIVGLNQYKKEPGIVANNEIIVQTGAANGAVSLSTNCNAIFAHNSLYVENVGSTTTTRVLNVLSGAGMWTIKNNLLVLGGTAAGYSIYLADSTVCLKHDINYNNYYVAQSASHIGYAGANKTTLANWKATVTQDKNSINIQPMFLNFPASMELTSYTGFQAPYLSNITTDIGGNIRAGITSMGAYEHNYTTDDALLTEFIDWRTGTLAGDKDTLKVVLKNGGTAPLTHVDIAWEFNNTAMITKPWNGNLAKGQADTVTLGEVIYTLGISSAKAWVKDFAADQYNLNDTIYIDGEFCDTMLNGTYIIGPTGDFATVNEIMDRINICGMNGNVTLALQDATYTSTIDMSKYTDISGNYTITIKPLSGNRDNVIIAPASGNGILVGNINNVVIDNITIDASAASTGTVYGIQFTDECNDIAITNCNIKVNATATTSTIVPIFKGSGTNQANNIVIKNNTLNGGYYGINFYGGNGTDEYGVGIVIDSNIVTNSYYYGIQIQYADMNSLSYNNVLSRTSNASTYWYGVTLTNVNANIIGNKIRATSSVTYPYMLQLAAFNLYNTSARGLVANNEIIAYTVSNYYGIYISGAAIADIVHNSVYMDGTGAARALHVASQALTDLTVKNNNFITTNTGGHPVYLAATSLIPQCDINYNNYSAPQYVGYAGAAMDLTAWRTAVPQDWASTNYTPDFVNINTGLQIKSTIGFRCPVLPTVPYDIDGLSRGLLTTKGVYHIEAYPIDIAPIAIVNLPSSANTNNRIPVEITIQNVGMDTLTSFDINWEINNTVKKITANRRLQPDDQVNYVIDTLVAQNGDNQITVWTSNPNHTADMNTANDTIRGSVVACSVPLATGTYTVGAGKDYSDMNAVATVLNNCGIAGDVTFSIYPGTYPMTLTLENIVGVNGINSLTFASATGNADDVTIRGVIIDANMNKISIENITIDASYTNAGVRLNPPLRDIRIYGCKINASPTVTATSTTVAGTFGVYLSANATNNTIENIQIIKNTIDGGYSGIYFVCGASGSLGGSEIYIDSNYVINQGYYGIYLNYATIESISHNAIMSKESTVAYWTSLNLSSVDVTIINANKIKQRYNDIASGYRIYLTTVNNTAKPALFSNNEVYGYANNNTYAMMILMGNTNTKVLFNSFYINGGNGASGFCVANNANIRSTIQYNSFFAAADSVYPIYFIRDVYKTTATLTMGNNNYYGTRFIGRAGETEVRYTSITAWRNEMTFDATSTNYQPNFINLANSLELSDYSNFFVPSISDVRKDILGNDRIGVTSIGCYTSPAPPINLALESIENWGNNTMAGSKDTVKVVLRNGGLNPITSAVISYKFNGATIQLPTWSGYLQTGDADTLTLGELQYLSGSNTLTVWINSFDPFPFDDTLSVSGYFCDTLMSGTYRIGPSVNAPFKTISEAVKVLYQCGIDGPVTFAIENGTYLEHVRLEQAISGSSPTNTVTFTAYSGNPLAVIIQRPDDATQNLAPFMLEGVSNVIITKLTLSSFSPLTSTYSYSNGVLLKNGCDNILIDSCLFTLVKFGSPSATTNHVGIAKPSSTGAVSNIRITNNYFDGGVYAVYMIGTTGTYNHNIYVADNTMPTQDKGSVYLQYADSVIIERNDMGQRNATAIGNLQTFQGIYFANANKITVLQNKINAARGIYGIYLYIVNTNGTIADGLIANNEIRMSFYETSSYARYGIYTSGVVKTKIYHNSIGLLSGNSNTLGHPMYVSSNANTDLDIRNNIFLTATEGASYPIYFADLADARRTTLANNDYYHAVPSRPNIGYAGSAAITMPAWQSFVPTDINSVAVMPKFVNLAASMDVQTSRGIACPVIPSISDDIAGNARGNATVMGAYHFESVPNDVMPISILSPTTTVRNAEDVIITIQSLGDYTLNDLTIYWELNGTLQQPYPWTGTLLPDSISAPILIGRITNYSGGENKLKIWTSDPNHTADARPQNDTIDMMFYGCDSALRGTYSIGTTGVFTTVNEAVGYLCKCGVSGPTTFQLANGEFEEDVAITEPIPGSSPTNVVTFTSQSGNYNNTTIKRASSPAVAIPALTLTNVSNLRFTNLKITGWSNNPSGASWAYSTAIVFNDGCSNVEISNCYVEIVYFTSHVTSTNYTSISRVYGNGNPISNIRILNNIISGGANGIYHSGSGTVKDNNILVQGNEIINVDRYGMYFSAGENFKILNNTITQRAKYSPTTPQQTFYGIYFSTNITGDNIIDANRIVSDTLYYGIYLGSYPATVSNNEIIANDAYPSSSSGIYAGGYSAQTTRIINNSILFKKGKATTIYNVRGIYIGSSSYDFEIKNNHIVTMDSMSVPIYFSSYAAARHDIDYNCYYNPYGHVGYVTSLRQTLSAWKSAVTNDVHSISEAPVYTNSTSLKLTNTANLTCPGVSGVTTDIEGYGRFGATLMGAYGAPPSNKDVAITELTGVPAAVASAGGGDIYTPSVKITNFGTTPVTSVILKWTLNGNTPAYTKTWAGGTLNTLDNVVFPLNPLTALVGNNDLVVWIESVNTLGIDDFQGNDTLKAAFHACDSLHHGVYTVGLNGDFTNITSAITAFNLCGTNGNITLSLIDSVYRENVDLTNLDAVMGNYSLTITSASGNRNSAIVRPTTGVAFLLNKTNNVTFENITIDASLGTANSYGIQFTGDASNILVNNCVILAHPTQTATTLAPIYKGTTAAVLKGLTVKNCTLSGGYYGAYLYGSSSNYGQNIVIDSNIITGQYNSGLYPYYMEISISYNKITPRSSGQGTTWYGIYAYYVRSSNIIGNRISANNTGITSTLYGIYPYNSNTSLFANNEIYLQSSASTTRGIYHYYSNTLSYFHNTVLITGTAATAQPFYVYVSGTSYSAIVKNNIFATIGSGATSRHAVYASANINAYQSNYQFDYNNYYTSGSVLAYCGAATNTLADWKAIATADVNSVNILPSFVNPSINLELTDYVDVSCPLIPSVPLDIRGYRRDIYTSMGAYTGAITNYDLELVQVVSPSAFGDLCSPDSLPVRFAIRNNGYTDCDFFTYPMELHFNMTGPIPFDTTFIINSGVLYGAATEIFELKDMVDVSAPGNYPIEAWISVPGFDVVSTNDTLRPAPYKNTKIALPFDNDFSTLDLTNLIVEKVLRDSVWHAEPYNVADASHTAPYYGTGLLVLRGERGTISRISTGQLELNKTQQPVLEFWYSHDNTNPNSDDQLDVLLTYDGGNTHTTLFNIMRYDPTVTSPTWKKYMVDLSPYQDSSCVIISFDGYSFGGIQQIDRIVISSNQDFAVSGLIVPKMQDCDFYNKDLKVVVTNNTGQNILFDNEPTSLRVEISFNSQLQATHTFPFNTGILHGLASDTLLISGFDYMPGTYSVKAYFTKSIDNTPANDTLKSVFSINPDIKIAAIPNTDESNRICFAMGSSATQSVTIQNKGNFDVYNLPLTLEIYRNGIKDTSFNDTLKNVLRAGASLPYTFPEAYNVPVEEQYNVVVRAELNCDVDISDNINNIVECVDMNDIELLELVTSNGPQPDNVGDAVNLTVKLKNNSPYDAFTGIKIHATIDNVPLPTGTVNLTAGQDTIYKFTSPYTVPAMSEYTIKVFVERVDIYQRNDTLTEKRKTNNGTLDISNTSFALGQNVPNPAADNTRIAYSIPNDGQVIFTVYTITGQTLHVEKRDASSGKNNIEFNTINLANGIYYYSIEYNGERLMKKMTIRR